MRSTWSARSPARWLPASCCCRGLAPCNALVALSACYVLSAVMLAARHRAWPSAIAVVLVLAAFIPVARDLGDPFKIAIDRRYGDILPEFWRHEGVQTAVSVRATRLQHVLYLDGLHQANDQPEMVKLHRMLGHLPMVLHGGAVDVLVVGMGGGATPGAVSQHPGARVQVVELSESVVKAAPFFAHVNYDLLNQAERQRAHRRWPQLPDVHRSPLRRDHRRHHPAGPRRRRPRLLARVLHAGAAARSSPTASCCSGSATARRSSTS